MNKQQLALLKERRNRLEAIERTIYRCKGLPPEERPKSFRQFAALTPYRQTQIDLLLAKDPELKQRVYKVLNPSNSVKACYEMWLKGERTKTRPVVIKTIEEAEQKGSTFATKEEFYRICGLNPSTIKYFLYINHDLRERFEALLENQKVALEILPTVANSYVRGNVRNTVQLSDTLRLVDLGGEIVAPCLNPDCQSRECVTQLQGWKDRSRYRRAHWALKGHLCRDCAGAVVRKYNKDKESVG